jgi:hypothetical protein
MTNAPGSGPSRNRAAADVSTAHSNPVTTPVMDRHPMASSKAAASTTSETSAAATTSPPRLSVARDQKHARYKNSTSQEKFAHYHPPFVISPQHSVAQTDMSETF